MNIVRELIYNTSALDPGTLKPINDFKSLHQVSAQIDMA